MPARTMVARNEEKSLSTNSSKALPVSKAGVQLFFSTAAAHD